MCPRSSKPPSWSPGNSRATVLCCATGTAMRVSATDGMSVDSTTQELSREEEQYLQRLENETLRAALPRGLEDEESIRLKYEAHYCITRNDWWFTMAGLAIGGFLSWNYRTVRPIAAAAIIAPGMDWAYSQSVCSEQMDLYKAHKAKMMEEYRRSAEEIKARVRQQHLAALRQQRQ